METNTETITAIAEIAEYVKQGAIVLGVTEVIKKWVPESSHDRVMPSIALVLGVGVVVVPKLLSGVPVTIDDVGIGVILGGVTTGLYSVYKSTRTY